MTSKLYVTYKFYDSKFRRLNVGGFVHMDNLIVFYSPCSKKDFFNKKLSRKELTSFYKSYLNHEEYKGMFKFTVVHMPINKDEVPFKKFLSYCKDIFFTKVIGNMELEIDLYI
jgi:hypothetical protein